MIFKVNQQIDCKEKKMQKCQEKFDECRMNLDQCYNNYFSNI